MKKIFAISVLSIMTVLSSNAWAGDTSLTEAYGLGSAADYNIATVQFVEGRVDNLYDSIDERVSKYNRDQRQKVVTTDANGFVQFSDTIEQGKVSGLTDALAGKVDDTQIANAAATVSTAKMDTMVPTVQRMANAIADAVTGVDTSGLVERAKVIKSDGKALSDGTTDLSSANADEIVPTVGMVAANFVPKEDVVAEELQQVAGAVQSGETIPTDVKEELNSSVPSVGAVASSFVPNLPSVTYNLGSETTVNSATDLQPGSYSLVVDVRPDKSVSYRWVAMSIGNSSSACLETTAGKSCES